VSLELRPITLREARAFIAAHHRHNEPPHGWLYGVALYAGGELRAVGVAGRPVARALQDGLTVELTRVCTLGDRNAASRLYGSLCRAAAALGYRRAITYTLESEPGSSVLAAGFRRAAAVEQRSLERTAHRTGIAAGPRALERPRLWEPAAHPLEAKVRWEREL